jgi:hypothetical protein
MPAVRFKVRCDKLFDWLRDTTQQHDKCKAFMGKVRYCPYAQLSHHAKLLGANDTNASPIAAKGLLMKRRAYSFEDEVRMLWVTRGPKHDGVGFPFDPLDLVEQFMIGPTKHEARYLLVESASLSAASR